MIWRKRHEICRNSCRTLAFVWFQGYPFSPYFRTYRWVAQAHGPQWSKVCTESTFWLEDSQWLVCCRGCGLVSGARWLFIHKPGGNCKWEHRHLPAHAFKDHIVLFLCKEQQDVQESNISSVFCTLFERFSSIYVLPRRFIKEDVSGEIKKYLSHLNRVFKIYLAFQS